MTTFGSVCSGIEAASVAWHPLGWKAAWLSEIEPFPCAVLAHHYPDVPNLGDMTKLVRKVLGGEIEAPDVFTGGTPCQAFSVAGKRQSLDDARGNLTLTFVEIADAIDHIRASRGDSPAVVVWENVPGVLSTKDNAFGCFLGALAGAGCELQPAGGRWTDAGCVYGPTRAVAWRVLDAQYFGLAQRRKRVFVVASARNGFDPAAVLFERDRVRRDSAPSREAREGSSASTAERAASRWGGVAMGSGQAGAEILTDGGAPTLTCLHEAPIVAHSLRGEGFDASEDGTGRGTPLVPVATFQQSSMKGKGTIGYDESGVAKPVKTQMDGQMVVHPVSVALRGREDGVAYTLDSVTQAVAFQPGNLMRGAGAPPSIEAFPTLRTSKGCGRSDQDPHVATSMAVRRLIPEECEALQGFERGYTKIPWRKKPAEECPDGPRYKALGNSWAVPVVRWIGRRIQEAIA